MDFLSDENQSIPPVETLSNGNTTFNESPI